MKKERSSFRASGIAVRSIIAAAALAVLVLSAALIRGGFDAFRQSDITAAGTGYTVRVAFADADGVGGGVFDVVPGEDVSYTVDIPIGSMLEILSGDVETENGRMTLTGVRAPTTVVYRVRRPGVYSLKIINDETCGTVTPGAGISTVTENERVYLSVTEKADTSLPAIRSAQRLTAAACCSPPSACIPILHPTMR